MPDAAVSPMSFALDRRSAAKALSSSVTSDAQALVVLDVEGRALAQTGPDTDPCVAGAKRYAHLCLQLEELGSELAPEFNCLNSPSGRWAPVALPIRHHRVGVVGAICAASDAAADNLMAAEAGRVAILTSIDGA